MKPRYQCGVQMMFNLSLLTLVKVSKLLNVSPRELICEKMNNKLNTTIRVPFKVSARTAKLIGLENFSTEEGAVIELVKNSYDADANNCILIFALKTKIEKIVDKDGSEIEIEIFEKENSSIFIIDNGIGMNDKIIQNQWMTIGTDNKLYEHTTELGRVKTGAKGIGRFALNRLGMLTDMTSLPALLEIEDENNILIEEGEEVVCTKLISNTNNIGFEWTVDWKDFDKKGQLYLILKLFYQRKKI